MQLRCVQAGDRDYKMLADLLDAYYFDVVGDIQKKYALENRPESFACRLVMYDQQIPVGCGCWKAVGTDTAEIKRIFVLPAYRRKGVASAILSALEEDIVRSGRSRIILETARATPASIAFYQALQYREICNYGSPAGEEHAVCFEKWMKT